MSNSPGSDTDIATATIRDDDDNVMEEGNASFSPSAFFQGDRSKKSIDQSSLVKPQSSGISSSVSSKSASLKKEKPISEMDLRQLQMEVLQLQKEAAQSTIDVNRKISTFLDTADQFMGKANELIEDAGPLSTCLPVVSNF